MTTSETSAADIESSLLGWLPGPLLDSTEADGVGAYIGYSPDGPWKRMDDLSEPWSQWFEEMVQKLAKSYSS